MIDDEDLEEGGLFFDLETEFLQTLEAAQSDIAKAAPDLQAQTGSTSRQELISWLSLVTKIWRVASCDAEENQLRPSFAKRPGGVTLPAAVTDRPGLVKEWMSCLAGAKKDEAAPAWLIPSGLQILLLAYYRSPRVFQGIKAASNLLPAPLLQKTVDTVRVPFGMGTVSWMTKAVIDQPASSWTRHLPDAGLDPAGRVAAQDFISGNRSVIGFPLFGTPGTPHETRIAGFFFFTHPLRGVFDEATTHDAVDQLRKKYSRHLSDYCLRRMLEERLRTADAYDAVPRDKWVQLVIPASDWLGIRAIRTHSSDSVPAFGVNEAAILKALHSRLDLTAAVRPWTRPWQAALGRQAATEGGSGSPLIARPFTASSEVPEKLRNQLWCLESALKQNEDQDLCDVVFPVLRPQCSLTNEIECPTPILAMIVFHWNPGKEGRDLAKVKAVRDAWQALALSLRDLLTQFTAILRKAQGDLATRKRIEDTWGIVGDYLVQACVQGITPRRENEEAERDAPPTDPLDVVEIVISDLTGAPSSLVTAFRETTRFFAAQLTQDTGPRISAPIVSFWSTRWLPDLELVAKDSPKVEAFASAVLNGSISLREAFFNRPGVNRSQEAGPAYGPDEGGDQRERGGSPLEAIGWTEDCWKGTAEEKDGCSACDKPTPPLTLGPVSVGAVPLEVGRRVFERLRGSSEQDVLEPLWHTVIDTARALEWRDAKAWSKDASRSRRDEDRQLQCLAEVAGSTEPAGKRRAASDAEFATHAFDVIRRRLELAETKVRDDDRRTVEKFRKRLEEVVGPRSKWHEAMAEENCEHNALIAIRELKAWFLGMKPADVARIAGSDGGRLNPIAGEGFKEIVGAGRGELTALGGTLLALSAYRSAVRKPNGVRFPEEVLKWVLEQNGSGAGENVVRLSGYRPQESMPDLAEAFREMCEQLFSRKKGAEDTLESVGLTTDAGERFWFKVKIDRTTIPSKLLSFATGGWVVSEGQKTSRSLLRFFGMSMVETRPDEPRVLLDRFRLPIVSVDQESGVTRFEWKREDR